MVKRLIALTLFLGMSALVGVKWPDVRTTATALWSARKTAIRPGDAAMTCNALEKELVATMSGPAVRKYAETSAVALQKEYDALHTAKAPMTGPKAATLASSLNSVTGVAQLAFAQARLTSNQLHSLTAILPQLMRSQRIIQLAFTKQCRWMVPS
jgi:hypothetical protein